MKRLLLLFVLMIFSCCLYAQEFIPLWPEKKMPNSKGLRLKDSIANERIYRVGKPGMYAFFTSAQERCGAAVLICPGGGYERLAYIVSGLQLARWFNTLGIDAFVLNYRLPNSPDLKEREKGPLQDAQRALKIITANAAKWKIDTDRIGIQGSSAGGHLATLAGTATEDIAIIGDSLDRTPCKPHFMILVSPVIDMGAWAHKGSRRNLLGEEPDSARVRLYSSQYRVTAATPPAFLVLAANDKAVDPQNSIAFYQALLEHSIPAALHIFPQGGHSITVHNNPGSTEHWAQLCSEWLRESGIVCVKK